MYICLNCYEVYDNHLKFDRTLEYNFCPKSCCDGDVIEIDELFIPVIIELNKKGYDTSSCCSGHTYDSYINSYIMFDEDVKLPSLPKGYMYDKDLYPHANWDMVDRNSMDCIRIVFDKKDKDSIELSKEIYENAINVLDWVKRLPDTDEDYCDDNSFCGYDGELGELDCSDKECEDCEYYLGDSEDDLEILVTGEFFKYYDGYGYPEFVKQVIHNLDDRDKYGLVGSITLVDAEPSKRVFIENGNDDMFIIRYFISEQDENGWKASYTLYKNIKCEDGSSHGEIIDEGFASARYDVGDGE